MAWWPFGKKKPGDPDDAPGTPQARPDVPLTDDPPGFDPGAPVVPGGEDGVGGVTLAVPPPSGALLAPPPTNDVFTPQGREDHFSQTLEDPDASAALASSSPATAADPFAQPAGHHDHFAQTMEDPDLAPAAAPPAPDPFARPRRATAQVMTPATPGSPDAPTVYAPGGGPDPFAAPPGADAFETLAAPADPFAPVPADPFAIPPDASERTVPLARPTNVRSGPAPQPVPPPSQAAVPPAGFRPKAAAPVAQAAPTPNAAAPLASAGAEETAMPANSPPATLSADKRRLGLALLAGGPITHERLLQELDRSGKSGSVLGKALLQSNFPREEELLAVLVARVRIPKINVKNTKIPLETIKLLPGDVAKRTRTLAIEKIGEILVVVSPDIGDEAALSAVRQATGCLISPIQCAAEGFDEILDGYYDRLAASGLATASEPAPAPAAPAADAFAPQAAPVAAAAPATGPIVAALPSDEGPEDSWDKIYGAPGPIPAEEVLL